VFLPLGAGATFFAELNQWSRAGATWGKNQEPEKSYLSPEP